MKELDVIILIFLAPQAAAHARLRCRTRICNMVRKSLDRTELPTPRGGGGFVLGCAERVFMQVGLILSWASASSRMIGGW